MTLAARAPATTDGLVTVSFAAGDLFLSDAEDHAYRLSWNADEPQAERRRALPAGSYRLRTYRIVRTEGGERWHVSATAPSLRRIEVRAGETTHVELDDTIAIHSRLSDTQAGMNIQGDSGAGLSIYRGAKRIPIDYRVRDEADVVVATGTMRYG